MDLMAIPFPFAAPGAQIAFEIGPLSVRWYGLAYLAGLLLGWLYMRRLCADGPVWPGGKSPMRPEKADDFLLWATVGTVVGGRLGFVLLYEPSMFIADPLRIFAVWEGGMAFHGGLLGVGLAIYLFARTNNIPVRALMDLSAAAVPFGLFFGRVANFINAEVYGRLTDVPWAVNFPARFLDPGHLPGPRHPTQLYEAFLEGAVMFALIRYLTHARNAFHSPGLATGAFLIAYGVFRIFAEYFKEWDMEQFFTTPYFSEAMVYCLPMIALGIYFIQTSRQTVPAGRSVRQS
jgi:phosphatidylglycerol:prolipoprotein diacylglycerol transferase